MIVWTIGGSLESEMALQQDQIEAEIGPGVPIGLKCFRRQRRIGARGVTMRRSLLCIAAAAIVALTETSGYAQNTDYTRETPGLFQGWASKKQLSNQLWKESDNCGRESFQKFPDYTTEGALKRDAYMRGCLRRHNAPPRADLVQPVQPQQ